MTAPAHLPLVDVAPLLQQAGGADRAGGSTADAVAAAIDHACRTTGFFRITGHGIDPGLLPRLDALAREFFALPDDEKAEIAMARAGAAWRGWFPVGGELTAGRPDRKEGLYVGIDHPGDHPRVRAGVPLHGANLVPRRPAGLGPAIDDWIAAVVPVAAAVLRGMALGLGVGSDWFERHLTADPTVLFRIFHYPSVATDDDAWGVAEHTDYGLLTVLAQDDAGGLQVHGPDGWIDVPPDPGVLVCNLGDMLERLTGGRYRSTPHRVRNASGRSRLSFPLFFDPSWDARVVELPLARAGDAPPPGGRPRWDGADVQAWEGTYGEYLTAKVARVFPELFDRVAAGSPQAE